MERAACILCLLWAPILGVACGDDDGDPCSCPADEVINCGHRGTGIKAAHNPYPENTIPSFQQAVAEGAQMIELDVMHSADGELVVFHYPTVEMTTDGTGCLGDMTTAELQQLDAGFGTSMEGEGVVIPTLLEALASVDVPINIEIKVEHEPACPTPDAALLAADVVEVIHGDPVAREVVVSSFDVDALVAVQDLDPSIYLAFLSPVWSDAQQAADHGFDALTFLGAFAVPAEVQSVLDTGVEANTYLVDTREQMLVLLGTGISMIVTDDPEVLEQARQDFCDDYCADD